MAEEGTATDRKRTCIKRRSYCAVRKKRSVPTENTILEVGQPENSLLGITISELTIVEERM